MGRKKTEKAKSSYPKGMTIRYSEEQEIEIQELMKRTGDNTMTRALLKTPQMLAEQHKIIQELRAENTEQRMKIQQLTNVVNSWNMFTKKVEAFVNGIPEQSSSQLPIRRYGDYDDQDKIKEECEW